MLSSVGGPGLRRRRSLFITVPVGSGFRSRSANPYGRFDIPRCRTQTDRMWPRQHGRSTGGPKIGVCVCVCVCGLIGSRRRCRRVNTVIRFDDVRLILQLRHKAAFTLSRYTFRVSREMRTQAGQKRETVVNMTPQRNPDSITYKSLAGFISQPSRHALLQ